MLEDQALDPIRITPDIVERGAGLWRQVADERSQPTACQRPYGTPWSPWTGMGAARSSPSCKRTMP